MLFLLLSLFLLLLVVVMVAMVMMLVLLLLPRFSLASRSKTSRRPIHILEAYNNRVLLCSCFLVRRDKEDTRNPPRFPLPPPANNSNVAPADPTRAVRSPGQDKVQGTRRREGEGRGGGRHRGIFSETPRGKVVTFDHVCIRPRIAAQSTSDPAYNDTFSLSSTYIQVYKRPSFRCAGLFTCEKNSIAEGR